MPSIAIRPLSLERDVAFSHALPATLVGIRRPAVSVPLRTVGGATTVPFPPAPPELTPAAVAAELGGGVTVPPAAAELPARTEDPPPEPDPAPTAETALAADEPP